MTDNRKFLDWGEVFDDRAPTVATVDCRVASLQCAQHQGRAIDSKRSGEPVCSVDRDLSRPRKRR